MTLTPMDGATVRTGGAARLSQKAGGNGNGIGLALAAARKAIAFGRQMLFANGVVEIILLQHGIAPMSR